LYDSKPLQNQASQTFSIGLLTKPLYRAGWLLVIRQSNQTRLPHQKTEKLRFVNQNPKLREIPGKEEVKYRVPVIPVVLVVLAGSTGLRYCTPYNVLSPYDLKRRASIVDPPLRTHYRYCINFFDTTT
jgi:hypothetical protein